MSSAIKHVSTKKAPAAIGPYSQAVIANGFVFTAGQIAFIPETMEVWNVKVSPFLLLISRF